MRPLLAVCFSALFTFSQSAPAQPSGEPPHPVSAHPDLNPADDEYSAPADIPLDELKNFANVFERIRSGYVEEVDDETLFGYAISGMLNALDPHSVYLQPEDFNELQESTSGKFGGLGIEVSQQDGVILVVSPIDDTPAQKAGIKSGDLIVSLDGQSVMGMSLSEAIDMMRGEPGSKISLEIRRQGENELLNFDIIRAEIKVTSVRSEMLSDDIGYIRITQFQEHTGAELNKILANWKNLSAIKGLVLDLRNNPGGVLEAAVQVSDAFIDDGLIVYTEGRLASSEFEFKASPKTAAGDLPVVVLINGGSASASEIVAGALQDHQRAVLVGTRSFGKGSVQSILPLAGDKAVKLTTARYFTPNGRSIQATGIEPDILVEQSDVTPREAPRRIKEADLKGHLNNDNAEDKKTAKTTDQPKPLGEQVNTPPSRDELLKRDFQLYEAHTLLRGLTILSSRQAN